MSKQKFRDEDDSQENKKDPLAEGLSDGGIKLPGDDSEGAPPVEPAGTTIMYGIHHGTYDTTGMTLKEVRENFGDHMNIDPDAVPVIAGQIIEDENTKIDHTVQMISFVKRASVKGARAAESLAFQGRVCTVKTATGSTEVSVSKAVRHIGNAARSPVPSYPLPPTVRWHVQQGEQDLFILELEPELRTVKWAATGSGKRVNYTERKIATPYVVIKAPFVKGLVKDCELFYRTEPLRDVTDQVCWSNLLNVSPNSNGCKAWICTQYLRLAEAEFKAKHGRSPTMLERLQLLTLHVFGSGFNRSSEENEGESCFSRAEKAGKLPQKVRNIAAWEKASIKDWKFVLKVPWEPVKGYTIKSMIDKAFPARNMASTKDVINVVQKEAH